MSAVVNNPTHKRKKFARARPICFNAPPSIDREAARRFLVRWIAEISALDNQMGRYMPLLLDRDLEPLAKKAIGQRIARAQAEQDQLRAALDQVTDETGQSAADLANACREAFREARQAFAEAATDSDFNRLVEAAVGPMVLLADGTLAQKQTTALSDGRLVGSVAGGGFDAANAVRAVTVRYKVAS